MTGPADSALLIRNAAAGSSDDAAVHRAVGILAEDLSVEVATTESARQLEEAVLGLGDRRLVIAGGDGSLNAAVAALRRRDLARRTELALIPVGTGNDFARFAGIPLDPGAAAELAARGTARAVDLIVDDAGGVVTNVVHLGAGASAARHGRRWKRRLGAVGAGRLAYPLGVVQTAFRPEGVRVRVLLDGAVIQGSDHAVLTVAIGNGANVGGGTGLTPYANAADGKADVMVSRAVRRRAMAGFLLQLTRGRHVSRSDVIYQRGSTVSVTGGPFYCSADGEIQGPLRQRRWRVEPGGWLMVMPS
ncbi:MAG: diacylglycerol/lipid kinase family protein [Nocardioides sp.]